MVEPAPGGECRPADAGTSQSGSCGLGDARGSSECLVTAGGGEGVWVPQWGRGSGNPGLVGGRQELSVCPVLSRDLFGPHPEERTMWALPSRPPDLTGTRPPAAALAVSSGPQSTSPTRIHRAGCRARIGGGASLWANRRLLVPAVRQTGLAEKRQKVSVEIGVGSTAGLDGGKSLYTWVPSDVVYKSRKILRCLTAVTEQIKL